LGAGGMGEVYRARDTRLDRLVAIKVLPAHLSENSDARARFQREAKAISGLTHPHICTLHDVGQHDGVDYLVMELLEGGTLADRLDSGPLPLEQVFRYGVEIADALERAHRAGVVHRDLKPGNVMLTKSGVKLLDFGLARMSAPKSGVGELSALPTAAPSRPLTEAGTVMGTVQYMAPEQLEGKEADARTDIFALGCILYEMATGRKAFSGASHASLITAIMSGEPAPISSLAPMTPPALDRLVRICLAKDPDERWQSAHDVKSELQWIAQAGSQAGLPAVVATRRKSRERLVWSAALVAAAILGAIAARLWHPAPPTTGATRFEIHPPFGEFLSAACLSPDGRTLLFAAPDASGARKLWLRPLDSVEPRPVADAKDLSEIGAWSPDGRSLAVPSGQKIIRIDLASGASQVVCATQTTFGLSWGAKGDLVFTSFYGSGIESVRASGGTPTPVTTLDRNAGEVAHLWPRFLPDGRRFVFFVRMKRGKEAHEGWIASASLDGKGVKRILLADSFVGVSEGRLLYTIAGVLYAQPFDSSALRVRGDPTAISAHPVIEGSIVYPTIEVGGPNLVFRSDPPKLRRLELVDRNGREIAQVGSSEPYERLVSISRDGRRALILRRNPERGDDDIWSVDLERGTGARSGTAVEEEQNPVWSPDGSRFVFGWDRDGPYDLAIRQFDGSKPDALLVRSDYDKVAEDWSRDGRFIVYRSYDPKQQEGIRLLTVGSRAPAATLPGTAQGSNAQISPDGGWILFLSSESGRREIYVQRFPDGAAREQVSVDGGGSPRWSPDGKEIFFVSLDGKMMAASFDSAGAIPKISLPRPLFPVSRVQLEEGYPGTQASDWDVAPDGRFLMLLPVSEKDATVLTVVLNWAAGLEHADR
ncbi:MAG TPA: protein kinase, partial [Thermoanaerobaculia bacterium]|nr:protein kinase [Thermoanaerobaculia bacterium]